MAAEIARIDAAPHAPDETTRQHALRDVVRHCVHGVDRNPLAVELCRTALWIETVEPGKPLTFLDAHIQLGDSLIGVLDPAVMAEGIPSDAYKPLTGDDKTACQALRKRNKDASASGQTSLFDDETVLEVAIAGADLDAMPEDTLDDVDRKSAAWKAVLNEDTRAREQLRADLFVGAFFADKSKDAAPQTPLSDDLRRVSDAMVRNSIVANVRELAAHHHFFHWHLAFAEVMQNGGFDVVLGNPPWEVSQLSEEEYFAVSAPHIADLAGARRKTAILELRALNPPLWRQYQAARRGYDARNAYCRGGRRTPLTAYGKLNSYALFAETASALVNPRGRAGLIVPHRDRH